MCEQHPDAPAVEFEARWTSWGDVSLRVATLHSTLAAAGLGPTDPVGVVVRERPPVVSALLALLAEARPVVLIASLAADEELRADVGRLPARAVVAEHRDWEREGLRTCVRSAGMVGVSLGDQPTDVAPVAGGPAPPTARASLDDGVAVLVPTSGTTGAPSRHAVTTDTLDEARTRVTVRDPEQTRGVTISAVPLSSIGGFMGLVSSVWRGRPIALMERFDLDRWVALVPRASTAAHRRAPGDHRRDRGPGPSP